MAAPMFSVMAASPSIDLKANGEISRMRSHKGNMPSLPQTKYCPLCPAKFTRTTHLNRHLRSHTNERLHRCNICNAEFTRSDLLTRHKRTCGDSINANRSRRKSCQACAESKVKCNLQYPCSKCTSRGRECIFINDPEASRNKKNASKKASSQSPSKVPAGNKGSGVAATSDNFSEPHSARTDYTSTYTSLDLTTSSPISPHSMFPTMVPTSYDLPTLSMSSGSSSTSSSHSSPRSEYFEAQPDLSGTYDVGFDSFALDSHLHRLYSNNMFEPFLEQPFHSCSPSGPSDFGWMEGTDIYPTYSDDTFTFPHGYEEQRFSTEFTTLGSTDSNASESPRTSSHGLSVIDPMPGLFYDASSVVTSRTHGPTAAELDHYLYLFFASFSTQVPLVHSSTWQMEDKPLILIRAMQACGALFAKTRTATAFITDTLASTRDTLIQEFTKVSTDAREQSHLILTIVLLQTIGLFHQRAEQRVSSNVYHGMLVMLIRRTGMINRIGAWVPFDLTNPQNLDAAWRDWADYETVKRALLLSYLHDCCHCMYFALPPSFQPSELDLSLPCDDALWSARDSRQWFERAHSPSPYGTGIPRIIGFGMQRALAVLGEMRLPTVPLALNPFAHFILIHTILRNIHASPDDSSGDFPLSAASPKDSAIGNEGPGDNAFAVQYALHNWLQMWLNSPESMGIEKSEEDPPFICDAMPFYWLAQVSLMAHQDGSTLFSGTSSGAKSEGRFLLMKKWLDHIRSFLRRRDQIPTHLWDELMKIRAQMTQENVFHDDELCNGLLAFFPGN
ncbi:fungal-specific transcription factor domain-containing protein [Collybia nuda]|uniref:Fungal-specific transcription factor domain-containing protein n=1 Tax=Collybia nuda TaxID=64659 RepID=A0A9P5Y5R8_9AGAR|nr:fungal-specific transcription factor domain-containing protein [Collybia nuda]